MNNVVKKLQWSVVTSIFLLILVSTQGYTQTPVGGVKGVVEDSTKAVIAGATISITKIGTTFNRTAITGDDGTYRFLSIAPGEYEIKVTKSGFNVETKRVIINVGLTGTVDFSMSIGNATESVNVVAEAPIIDTTDQAIKAQITSDNISKLPLNGRNFLDLSVVAPGATPVSGDNFDPTKAGYTGVSIGGQMGRSTRIALDGGDINDEVVGTTTQNFSPEIIQEFQISTSSYDVSTGASSSGAVNIITRGGQNAFHGAGYLYFRNDALSAFPGLIKNPDPDGVVRKPPFDREQYGGTLSGPIIRDRVYWFANFEKNNQDQQALIGTGLGAGNPFDGAVPQPFDERLSTVKIDARLNDNHTIFGRWSRNDNQQFAFFPAGAGIAKAPASCTLCTSNAGLQTNLANQIITGLTSSIGSRIINEARFNFSTLGNRISPQGTGPEIRIRNTNFKIGTNRIFPQSTFQNRYQLRDDFTLQGARNTIRSGVSWNHTEIFGTFQFWSPGDIQLHAPDAVGKIFPTSDADLLNWPVRFVRVGVGDPTLPINTPGNKTINNRISFYGEDSIKLTRNFTLNLGVNYRYDSNLVNHDMRKPAILSSLLGGNLSPTQIDKNNWGGRMGIAWDLKGNGATVIRAGYGLYYDTAIDNLRLFERGDLGPAGGGYVSFDLNSYTFPTFPGNKDNVFTVAENYTLSKALADLSAIRASLLASPDPTKTNIDAHGTGAILDSNLATPYSNQINVGIQQKLPFGMVFTSDFLYRLTVREYLAVDVNHAAAAIGPINPLLTTVGVTKSIGNSKYLAGNFRVERRFAKGFSFAGTYVLSQFKAVNADGLGLGGAAYNDFNVHESYGHSGLDRTHRFTLTSNWDLPGYKGSNWFGKSLLRDWSLGLISTFSSGAPFTVFVDEVSLTGSSDSQANLLDGAPFGSIGRSIKTVKQLNDLIAKWNTNRAGKLDRFDRVIPALASLPDDGSIKFGDSSISQDLRITKSIRIGEKARIHGITEFFNLFNVANLTGHGTNPLLPVAGTTSPSFFIPNSRATSVFGFGGPRAVQFAVRFEF